jgi:hypothetical protein
VDDVRGGSEYFREANQAGFSINDGQEVPSSFFTDNQVTLEISHSLALVDFFRSLLDGKPGKGLGPTRRGESFFSGPAGVPEIFPQLSAFFAVPINVSVNRLNTDNRTLFEASTANNLFGTPLFTEAMIDPLFDFSVDFELRPAFLASLLALLRRIDRAIALAGDVAVSFQFAEHGTAGAMDSTGDFSEG